MAGFEIMEVGESIREDIKKLSKVLIDADVFTIFTIPPDAKRIIGDIAARCRETRIYRHSEREREAFVSECLKATGKYTSYDALVFMIDRAVNAPMLFLRYSSYILLMPIIDDLIKREDGEND